MDFTYNPFTKEVHIKLSRKNLEELVGILNEDSNKVLVRTTANDWLMSVTPEEDEKHYGNRPK